MKKITALLLVFSMMFSLCACGNGFTRVDVENPSEAMTETEEIVSTEVTTETETETTSETTSEVTSETTTQVTTETTTESESQKKEPEKVDIVTKPQTAPIVHVGTEGNVNADSLAEHGKELQVYGNLNANTPEMQELAQLLAGYDKNITVSIWKADGTAAFTYNTQQGYFSACTIKAAYILYCCKQIESGAASADTLMTYQEKHWHKGSGQIKNAAYGTQYTLRYLIQQALYISDNVAYEMLVDYFGMNGYKDMVNGMGCGSLIPSPTIWAYNVLSNDYIVIWDAIYDYFETGTEMANLFYSSCKNTPFNYGTETLKVDYNHKSGDNFGKYASYHDAGIVWSGDDTYMYAVFTNSEGKSNDIATVNRAMELAYAIMTKY